ncbi:hypothetical protein E8E13_006806 [Curvularia kusanoi]|uniref:Uncharacterized protein n=1 Tax=Curvularia kusanoi TaxID=90978 RepID=A0A9P4W9L4_CURKU|nr:hypothetical protein E8E13_006806 [Curvularia kusanoi]
MGIKRKHFDDASPTSISSSGAVSTPDAQSPTHFPLGMDGSMDMDMDTQSNSRSNGWDFTRAHRVKPSDWGNRTRKRVRDNRPDERAVHENTVHKLFLAQRQHPHASPVPSDPQPSAQPAIAVSKPQKSTLHSFWNIAAPPVQAPVFSYQATHAPNGAHTLRCDDCDAQLEAEDEGMDIDVDMDSIEGTSSLACRKCGRNVCGRCAVVGDARHCLQCATHGY